MVKNVDFSDPTGGANSMFYGRLLALVLLPIHQRRSAFLAVAIYRASRQKIFMKMLQYFLLIIFLVCNTKFINIL